MKFSVAALLVVATIACAENVQQVSPDSNSVLGYLTTFAIPNAERLRKAEEDFQLTQSRIAGGSPAAAGQYPWQAGLLIDIIGLDGSGVCGGSLLSASRVITAAHCWFDGYNQAWRFTVVLGSTMIYYGGIRVQTSAVFMHPTWNPNLVSDDVAMIYLPAPVTFSNIISPIALPSGSEVNENFVGEKVIASGFGITGSDAAITAGQVLSHVQLTVIPNILCRVAFPNNVQASNICTSGFGGVGTCGGDSGGPLVAFRNNRPILIGITSFGSALGCDVNFPAAYARTTSYLDFINQNL